MIIWILGSTFKLLYIRTTATYFSCTRATTNYYCVLLLLLTTTTTTVPVRTTTLENFGEWVRMGWPAAPSWRLPLWQQDVVDIAIIIMLVGARWWWRWRQHIIVTEAIIMMERRVFSHSHPFSKVVAVVTLVPVVLAVRYDHSSSPSSSCWVLQDDDGDDENVSLSQR